MILNRLIFPQGNKLEFTVSHSENGEKYQPADGESYYMSISLVQEPYEAMMTFTSDNNHFSVQSDLEYGEYVFEIGITDSSGSSRIILPAVDERGNPLNQLLILRRLKK